MILLYVFLLVILLVVVVGFPSKKTSCMEKTIDDIVLVSAHWNEDLEWLKKAPCPVVVCDKEGAKPHTMKSDERYSCPVTINSGREASAYLDFIVNNYDNLPEYVAFIHGHEKSYHQDKDILKEIRDEKWRNSDYYPLNDSFWYWDKERSVEFKYLLQKWDEIFRPMLNRDPPTSIRTICCSQFIVPRKKIHSYDKDTWKRLLDYVIVKVDTDTNNTTPGATMEMMWHVIFGYPYTIEKREDY